MNKQEFIKWLENTQDILHSVGTEIGNSTLLDMIIEKAEKLETTPHYDNIFRFPRFEELENLPKQFYRDIKTWVNGELVQDIVQEGKLPSPNDWSVEKTENDFKVNKK